MNTLTIKVAIGSLNPIKIQAVELAFREVWQKKKFIFLGFNVKSGISDQPMSDEEAQFGAINRAWASINLARADFGVGIEGGISKVGEDYFDCSSIIVIDRKGAMGKGFTHRLMIPPEVMDLVHKGIELGEANDTIFGQVNSKQNNGNTGLMTNNIITRRSADRCGVIIALTRFINPEFYSK